MISVEIKGLREMERTLIRLERKGGRAVVRKALRVATKPVQKQTKTNAKAMVGGEMGGLLAKNIVVRAAKKRPYEYRLLMMPKPDVPEFLSFTQGSSFSLKSKKQTTGKQYYIPNAIEFGHAFPGKGGSGNKDVAPIPFMRSAMDAKEDEARRVFMREVKNGITRVITYGG